MKKLLPRRNNTRLPNRKDGSPKEKTMALAFNQSKGKAQKSDIDAFEFKNGMNTFRVVGDILARYVYWVEGENSKNIPMECLAFDRNEEAFNNREKDWVKVYFPDLKCSWSYATQVIDGGKIKVINLKKKMWEAVVTAAEDLGDPTDPDEGWDIVVERKKTGPLPFNVEYILHVLKCKKRPLDEEERALLEDLKSMDDVMPRPTPDAQKALLDKITNSSGSSAATENADEEALEDEFKVD